MCIWHSEGKEVGICFTNVPVCSIKGNKKALKARSKLCSWRGEACEPWPGWGKHLLVFKK